MMVKMLVLQYLYDLSDVRLPATENEKNIGKELAKNGKTAG